MNRRTFLTTTAALGASTASSASAASSPDLRLGVCTYSVRKFTRTQAIAMLRELGVKYVNVKEYHLPYKSTPEELAAALAEFRGAGMEIIAGGSIDIEKDDDAGVRRYFEYAKACGMPVMVIATEGRILPRIEKFVKEYNIKVAVHNHGPEDKEFPTPNKALEAVRGMDPRMGVCVDVGHTMRAGVDVVESIRLSGARLFDVHMKDLHALADRKSQCPVGDGVVPVAAILKQLKRMKYAGVVSLEYEAEPEAPLKGMLKSLAFERGLLEGLRG